MKIILLEIFVLVGFLITYSQDWVGELRLSGDIQNSDDTHIAVDHQGNIIVADYY